MEHSRGKSTYEREIEGQMQGYFQEAKRYQRPISTNLYPNDDAMFDSHTYPKGGVVLYGLRQYMGDKAFFAGIKYYLTQYRHQPVDTQIFTAAMSKGGGIDISAYIAQWILKPGHPVIEYTHRFDAAKSEVVLSVKQTQDTKNGTPIYTIPTQVWLRTGEKSQVVPVTLQGENQEIHLPTTQKPDAVLLDPNHGFLRQMVRKDGSDEDLTIALYASNAIDRTEALTRVMAGTPDAATIEKLLAAVRADSAMFPVYGTIRPLYQNTVKAPRAFFLSQLNHASPTRRAEAIEALGAVPPATSEETQQEKQLLQTIVQSKTTMYGEVNAALSVLLQRDTASNLPTLLALTQKDTPRPLRLNALRRLSDIKGETARINPLLVSALSEEDFMVVMTSVQTLRARKDVSVLPELQKLQAAQTKKSRFLPAMLTRLIEDLGGKK
jgi:aminopeptidase N